MSTTNEKVISNIDFNGNIYNFKDTAAREQLINHSAALQIATEHVADKNNPHQVELSDFGINATATEINILQGANGITSNNMNNLSGLSENVQNKLDNLTTTITNLPNSIELTGTPTTPTPVPPQGETTPLDGQIANVEYVKQEINKVLSASEAMTFKGVLNVVTGTPATIEPPSKADVGDTYKIGVAAKFADQNCEIGDLAICITGYEATPTSNLTTCWVVVQSNIDGAVTGPTGSTDGNLAIFDGTSGKIIKDSNVSLDYVNGLAGAITEVSNRIPTGFTITPTTLTGDDIISLTGDGGTNSFSLKAEHAKVEALPDGYIGENTVTSISGYGAEETIKIPQITVDAYGHVTAAEDKGITITMPPAQTFSGDDIIGFSPSSDANVSYNVSHAEKYNGDGFTHENDNGGFFIPNLTIDKYGHTTKVDDGQEFIVSDFLPTEVINGAICIVY